MCLVWVDSFTLCKSSSIQTDYPVGQSRHNLTGTHQPTGENQHSASEVTNITSQVETNSTKATTVTTVSPGSLVTSPQTTPRVTTFATTASTGTTAPSTTASSSPTSQSSLPVTPTTEPGRSWWWFEFLLGLFITVAVVTVLWACIFLLRWFLRKFCRRCCSIFCHMMESVDLQSSDSSYSMQSM